MCILKKAHRRPELKFEDIKTTKKTSINPVGPVLELIAATSASNALPFNFYENKGNRNVIKEIVVHCGGQIGPQFEFLMDKAERRAIGNNVDALATEFRDVSKFFKPTFIRSAMVGYGFFFAAMASLD